MTKNIKPVFKCSEEFKKQFSRSCCLLTISVGQEVHEGEKFSSTIELVRSSFQSCIVLIDDSLQRHTMALDKSHDPEHFYPISIEEGDKWLERNKINISKLTNLEKVIRWDTWIKHQNFEATKNHILQHIEHDLTYQSSFTNAIDAFLSRYFSRLINSEHINTERAKKLCMDYLIEECAALCLWPELNCHFEVYPSPRNLAMSATHQHFVLPTYPNLLHPVAIKFKNRKQLRPQEFKSLANEAMIS